LLLVDHLVKEKNIKNEIVKTAAREACFLFSNKAARVLTVADGVDKGSDELVGGRERGVAVGDDHVVLIGEAGDRRQDVPVEPRLGGDHEERDTDPPALGRLVECSLAVARVAVRQQDRYERRVPPSFTAFMTHTDWNCRMGRTYVHTHATRCCAALRDV